MEALHTSPPARSGLLPGVLHVPPVLLVQVAGLAFAAAAVPRAGHRRSCRHFSAIRHLSAHRT